MEGSEWREFLVICEALEDPDFELTVEEWAPFYAAFLRLLAAGVPFDPEFVTHMEELNREAMGCDDDSDHDDADEWLDLEEDAEPDEVEETQWRYA